MKSKFLSLALLIAFPASSSALPQTATSPLAALDSAQTVQVTETVSVVPPSGVLTPAATLSVTLSKPGLARMEQSETGAKVPGEIVISDGKTLTDLNVSRNQYRKDDAPPDGFGASGLPTLRPIPAGVAPTRTMLDGKPALLYKTVKQDEQGTLVQKLWLDTATKLPIRQSLLDGTGPTAKERQRTDFTGWVLNKPVDSTLFAFVPPTGATEFKPPVLLATGTVAPDFTVQDKDGKPVKLSDYKGKVVVIDFWATWCGPCQQSLPHTNAVAEQMKQAVFLGVNVWDTKVAFDKWLPEHKQYDALTFLIDPSPSGKDVASSLYNVSGIPTQYVIGPDGKVAASFVGYGSPTDDLANAIKKAGASS